MAVDLDVELVDRIVSRALDELGDIATQSIKALSDALTTRILTAGPRHRPTRATK